MIGAFWFLAQVAGVGAVVVGVFAPRLQWMSAPWWWVVLIFVDANSVAHFAADGDWWLAALCAVVAFGSLGYLLCALVGRHQQAAHRAERWQWSP